MKREAISRDDFATCTQSYFLYGIHYGSRLVCRHTAKALPRVTRSRYTSVGKETLCRVSFLEHTAKKKCTRQPLDGSLQLCRVPGEMHTAKRGDAHIKVWIFAVCCGSYTQQKMDQGQLNWLLCRVPWSLHTAKWQYFVCVFILSRIWYPNQYKRFKYITIIIEYNSYITISITGSLYSQVMHKCK